MKASTLKHISKNFSHIMEEMAVECTPKELSEKAKISYSTLAPILRGDRDFGVTKLIALAEALNVTPNDILSGAYKEPTLLNSETTPTLQPFYLVSFVTSAKMSRCCAYNIETKESKSKLFPFSLSCTTNAVTTLEMINSAIIDLCGQDIDFSRIYVYASVLGYEHLEGRAKLADLGSREYGLFFMEPDWKIEHSSIFPDKNGIMVTINDGYVISYSTDNGKQVNKLQGYIIMADEAGNIWLGSQAIKHAINVKEGIETRTLLSDKVLSLVHSDLNLLATKVFDKPRDTYVEVSTIVKELGLREKKSYSLIKHGFENIWKRIKLIDNQLSEELPICLAGELAYLYEEFIPKARLLKRDFVNEEKCFDYAKDLLLRMLPK